MAPRPQFAQGDNGTWTVNSLADPGDGTCDDTECTLREAIDAAASGDNVVFATGLQGEVQVTAGELQILQKDLAIDGDGRITVDAQNASRVFRVASVLGNYEATIAGMTIEDGTLPDELGAGIWVTQGGHLRLENVTVAHNATGGSGGGIYIQAGSSLTLVNSTVRDNFAQSGAGISNNGDLTILASTNSGNTAEGGGGIVNGGAATATKTTITNKADVASDAVDPNRANNTASLTVSVAAGSTKPPAKGK